MYDHRSKVAWWWNARFILQVLILPGLLGLVLLADYIFNRTSLVKTTAIVVEVSEICEAEKRTGNSGPEDFVAAAALKLDCVRYEQLLSGGLDPSGYELTWKSEIKYQYRSPVDNLTRQETVVVEGITISVGDRVPIKASKTDARWSWLDETYFAAEQRSYVSPHPFGFSPFSGAIPGLIRDLALLMRFRSRLKAGTAQLLSRA